jgi:hypothetical protein
MAKPCPLNAQFTLADELESEAEIARTSMLFTATWNEALCGDNTPLVVGVVERLVRSGGNKGIRLV